ncbi:BadF/BadG/BcrA/BcrD ATPase family protein [Streptomyces sp. NPDC101132]|uniref:BadF/BadG/BcrA/BcrD ATPase family protein n=1 Tax=Streptomyces sp. NPDC101132 TaxID=3366110 RepID=UPI003829003A
MSDGAGEPWFAGIDVGGTGIRIALARSGRPASLEAARTAELAAPARITAAGHDGEALLAAVLPALRGLLDAAGAAGAEAVAVGATGMALLGRDLAARLPGPLARETGARYLALASDAVTAHIGALGTRHGVVVAGGTGLVAVGSHPAEGWRRADGWGQLLGDCGGGAWIGRAGLEAALRQHDGRAGGSAALLALAAEEFGPVAGLPAALQPRADRAGLLAGFAPAVGRAAAEGDPVAALVLDRAAEEIAASATAAAAGLPSPHLCLTGGLFRLPGLADAVRRHVAAHLPDARWTAPDGPPLLGALRLASALPSPPWPPSPPLLDVLTLGG